MTIMAEKILKLIRFLSNSFLFKLFLFYSVIIILMLFVLTFVISGNFSGILKQKEINYESQITRRVSDYLDRNINSAKNIVEQIYLSDSYTKASFFNFLESDNQNITLDYLNERNKFNNLFMPAVTGENDILDIIFYKSKTNEIFFFSKNMRKFNSNFDFNVYPWFGTISDSGGVLKIVPSYYPKYMQNDRRPVYTVVAGFNDTQNINAGIIMINFDAQKLEKSYSEYKDKVKGVIMVFDKAGNVFYDSSNRYYGAKYSFFSLLKQSNDYIMLDKECIVSIDGSGSNGLIAAGIIPKEQIIDSINIIVGTIYLVMVICTGISIILIYMASTFFSKKIKTIIKAMKEVEKGNLGKRIPAGKGNDEIEQIYKNFNSMCEKLGKYIDKIYLAEIRMKDAELTALQTQINPHFLYNTLEAVRMKAIVSNNDDVSEMIYILANLFRNSVKNKDMVIKIEDEINYCKSYLELHKIRHGDRLKVIFDINPDIMHYGTSKLILQPLIENSLLYGGLDENMDSMTITVQGFKEDGNIIIHVIDNGKGMEENELELVKTSLKDKRDIKSGGSIGLKNINDRLKIIFGEKYGLDISSEKGACTKVTVIMPAKTVEEVNKHVQDIGS